MDNLREQLREKVFSKFQKDTWEIKTLGEIATDIYSGDGVSKEQLGGGNYPAIKAGDVNGDLNLIFEECISFVNIDEIKNKKYFEHGDLLMSHFGDKDTVATTCAYVGKEKCLAGKNIYVIKHTQNPKYLAYALSSEFSRKQIQNLSSSSIVIYLYMKEMKKIQIPLPPLEIQDQIVNFLDKFSELERELKIEWEKESDKRKEQYEYYRELLFKQGLEEHKWPLKRIEDIAQEIISGNEITKDQLGTGDHPAIRIKEVYDSPLAIEECINFVDPTLIKRRKYCEYGNILLASASENLRDFGKACVYLGRDRCLIGNDIKIIKHSLNPKYLAYCFSTDEFLREIKRYSSGVKVLHLNTEKFKGIQIPVPPQEEQKRIVDILDVLHRIVHDFNGGIPLLIQKNREQYEFYRELLLSPSRDI